jgi:hypothetical protein
LYEKFKPNAKILRREIDQILSQDVGASLERNDNIVFEKHKDADIMYSLHCSFKEYEVEILMNRQDVDVFAVVHVEYDAG